MFLRSESSLIVLSVIICTTFIILQVASVYSFVIEDQCYNTRRRSQAFPTTKRKIERQQINDRNLLLGGGCTLQQKQLISSPTTTTTISSSTTMLWMGRHNQKQSKSRNKAPAVGRKLVQETMYISVDPAGHDVWKTMDVVDIILRGGVGVVPSESGYGFITSIDSKKGLERITQIHKLILNSQPQNREMSLLCSNIGTIDSYCYGIDKQVFKILKNNLPGPYTFQLPASKSLPKVMATSEGGGAKHKWVEQTIGVRIPSDPIIRYLHDELLDGIPLCMSSIPSENDDDDDDFGEVLQVIQCPLDPDASWCKAVDFIIDAGERPIDIGSTTIDLTGRGGEPEIIQEGIGDMMELAL